MKRQSTVAKLSKTMLKQLIEFCQTWNCGVILRFRGIEYGYTVEQLQAVTISKGEWYPENRCFAPFVLPMVRKGWDSPAQLTTQYNELTDTEFLSIVLGGPVVLSDEFSVLA